MAEICPIGLVHVGTRGGASRRTTLPASLRNCSTRFVHGLTARLQPAGPMGEDLNSAPPLLPALQFLCQPGDRRSGGMAAGESLRQLGPTSNIIRPDIDLSPTLWYPRKGCQTDGRRLS